MINKIIMVLLFLWFASVLNWVISLIVSFVTKETDYMAVSAIIESFIAIIIVFFYSNINKMKGQRYERFGNRRSDRGRDGFCPGLGMGIWD